MPEVKSYGHVALMRKIFEQQLPKDVSKDTLVNERNSFNSNPNFDYSKLDGKDSKRPEKKILTESSERRDTLSVYGKREGVEAIYDKLNPLEKKTANGWRSAFFARGDKRGIAVEKPTENKRRVAHLRQRGGA
ncbi:hypothetical protein BK025_02010 [Sodalis sp. TME1]|nr:hypothetical protein BK025_02010 [Sodalis sp. TME1]